MTACAQAIAEAKSELGAEWVDLLQKRFQSSTEEVGAMQLSKDDMFKLMKVILILCRI